MKRECCRFCMHSYLRTMPVNNFCPLDLYSKDQSRIRKALNVLLKEKPLEKTLTVSINGKKVLLESKIDQQLVSTFKNNDHADTLLQDILGHIILKDPILQIIKNLQMNLDEIDVEGIFLLCQQNSEYSTLVTNDINIWKNVVHRYQRRCQKEPFSRSKFIHEVEEQRQKVYEYILSMTFKDCSLMINVTPKTVKNNSDKIITLGNGSSFQYDVKVIDTDLKSIDKIPFWFELDQSIVKHATETNFEKKCH